ncbi:hypothetical protein CQ042_12550 [Microbacterium sp. MYb62]|nr:hypothetical protein CQ042_12550 [Microbacterium sp. MYb62]
MDRPDRAFFSGSTTTSAVGAAFSAAAFAAVVFAAVAFAGVRAAPGFFAAVDFAAVFFAAGVRVVFGEAVEAAGACFSVGARFADAF